MSSPEQVLDAAHLVLRHRHLSSGTWTVVLYRDLARVRAGLKTGVTRPPILCAEAVLCGFSPGFDEPYDSTRTLIAQTLTPYEMEQVLELARKTRRIHLPSRVP